MGARSNRVKQVSCQAFCPSGFFQDQLLVNKDVFIPEDPRYLQAAAVRLAGIFFAKGRGSPARWMWEYPYSILLKSFWCFLNDRYMGKNKSFFFLCFLWGMCCGFTGLLWNPQGPGGQLAVPDVCPGGSAKMFAVSQERRSDEAYPQWHQMGPCQLCFVDP